VILSLALVCASLGVVQGDGELELRLEGPLKVLHLDGVRVATQVLVDLAESESITLRVPWLPVDPSSAPQLRVAEGEGSARVEEIHPAPMRAPEALKRRPLPRPVELPARIPATAWWLFGAGILAVGAARKRPISALLVGALFGVGVLFASPPKRPLLPTVAVLEVGPAGEWWVYVAPSRLVLAVGTQLELETVPEGASWELTIDAMDPARPQRIATAGRGTLLVGRRPGPVVSWLDGEPGSRGPRTLGIWSEFWRRSGQGEWSQGAWSHDGVWEPGSAQNAPQRGRNLPTWLRAGASPGVTVWLGKLSDPPSGVDEAWVRVIWPAQN
jgi:hypothetical protein